MKQWHLSISQISLIVAATSLGMFIGSTGGGWFSDRVGRKRALISTTLWYSGFSLLSALAWEPAGLFVARLLAGVGVSGMTVVGITYVSEMFPAAKRGTYQGWIMATGLLGIPVTAYVARFCIPLASWGWRLVFIWGSFGMLMALLARRLEESPRWLENHGRTTEADEVLSRIEEQTRAEGTELSLPREWNAPAARPGAYRDLFSQAYRRQTIVLIVAWICQTLGLYGFMSWVPTLLVAHGFSLVNSLAWSSAISIGAPLGALVGALISDRWERRWLIAAVALLVAICGWRYGTAFSTLPIVILGLLVAALLQTFAALLLAYTPETYPTEIRNSGAGLAYGIGRLANTGGPLLLAFFYNHYGYTSVFVYIAVCWVLVAISIGGFGIKTRGQTLELLSTRRPGG